MPLKILKRGTSKQYNVVSKSTFVISVILLDNSTMECTLDFDSTGADCLGNISQRLGLHQPEFFGLRYISRGVPPRERWVDLDRPLKKQLEKYAEDSQLSLGVMYYVCDVNLLKDEMTRYHYFLQLKSDVIEGKLNCSIDQAISLAAYSLQAEFGDYFQEKHTIEYLRDFAILPKELTRGEKFRDLNIDALFEAVARQYGSLTGFPPNLAEIYYIMVAQQLDGYGQEAYPAKDDSGNDILLCVSAKGLLIRRRDWTHIAAFMWSDIKSLLGHKRLLVLESAQSQRTMQFHFTDPETVKYVKKICQLQTIFTTESLRAANSIEANAQSVPQNLRSTPDLIAPSSVGRTESQYSLNNNLTANSNYSNSQYFPVASQQQPLYLHRSLQELNGINRPAISSRPLTPLIGNAETNCFLSDFGVSGINLNYNPNGLVGPEPIPSSEMLQQQQLLPSYRPAPDYDTAVQLKYGVTGENKDLMFEQSRLEEEEPIYQNEIVSQIHSIEFRDSNQQPGISKTNSETSMYSSGPQLPISSVSLPPGAPILFSSPDDANQYMYKAPPPYPGTSNSIQYIQQQTNKSKYGNSCSTSTLASAPSGFGVVGGLTKPRSSFNTHAEILRQISAQLKQSSTSNINRHSSSQSLSSSNTTSEDPNQSNSVTNSQSSITNLSSSEVNASRSEEIYALESAKLITKHKSPLSSGVTLYGKPIDPIVLKEFHGIQKAKPNPSFTTAMRRENSKLNRCPTILPYEDNSIRLTSCRYNQTGYINASPISVKIGDKIWKYIVGQIPLAGNGHSLWQLVWETETKILVVLERDSSALFYPSDPGVAQTYGDFQVSDSKNDNVSTLSVSASIAREVTITYLSKKKQRKVWILPYEDEWRDDVPVHTEHFLCFLEEVNSVQRKVSESNTPLTVLCGNGAGRSGVFILSDLLLHAADSGHKLRCDNLLSDLRLQRMLLVSYAPQYAFVLHTLAKYLAQSRLI